VTGQPARRFHAADLISGISVTLIAIPQSMAYAELAGLPSQHGLYAAALPAIAAAFFASSVYLQTGPGALTALLTFGALSPLAAPGSPEFIGLAALLALVVGSVRVLVGTLRVGWLSYLMSAPMLGGFTSAAAILILLSQLPGALGSAAPDGSVLGRAVWAATHPDSWQVGAIGLAVVTIVLVQGARRIHPLVPGVLIAAGAGLAWSIMTGYDGATVGAVPSGLPPVSLALPWTRLPSLLLPGVVIALIGFSEAASISRVFATEDRQKWEADREFLSQGVANLAAGISGGFPVGGSFSRSSANRLAGAKSRWSGLVTGLGVLAFLPVASVLAPMPKAVLAGIVMASVVSLFRPKELMALWPLSRPQAAVAWSTFALTLLLAPHVEHAVVLGMAIAGAIHLWRELTPEIRSRQDGSTLYLEPEGILWFASAPGLEDLILRELADHSDLDTVVLDCGGLGRIDLTGMFGLRELVHQVRGAGVAIRIEEVPQHALRLFGKVDLGLVQEGSGRSWVLPRPRSPEPHGTPE
jgi:SulP family sulfate permease